jgi:hypothetical protein
MAQRMMLTEDKPTKFPPYQYYLVAAIVGGLGVFGITQDWQSVPYLPNPYIFVGVGLLCALGFFGGLKADETGLTVTTFPLLCSKKYPWNTLNVEFSTTVNRRVYICTSAVRYPAALSIGIQRHLVWQCS